MIVLRTAEEPDRRALPDMIPGTLVRSADRAGREPVST